MDMDLLLVSPLVTGVFDGDVSLISRRINDFAFLSTSILAEAMIFSMKTF